MKKTLILISFCERVREFEEGSYLCRFHFKGACLGYRIRAVELKMAERIEEGTEYLIYAEIERIQKQTLYGKALKTRKLDDLKVEL